MSRCFPFPPPAYVSKGARSEALIESIKKQEEEKSKKERKIEKKLRKERRKERKEKKRLLSDCCTDDKVKKENYLELDKKKADPRKGIKDEAEQLEKSDLTEEHDQPTSFESSRYFSDSTQSSNKRKRQSSLSSNGNQNQNHRPIIRIQLSLRKHKEPDSGRPKSAQEDITGLAESSVRERTFSGHVPTENQFFHTDAETNIESEKVAPKSGQELSSERKETCSQTRTGKETSSCENEFQRTESLYMTLTENWVPPQLNFCQNDVDDVEWLIGTQQQHNLGSKRHKVGNEVSCCRSSTLWPQAQFLPDSDIYALPYTIPF